jgi:hypothetical protein
VTLPDMTVGRSGSEAAAASSLRSQATAPYPRSDPSRADALCAPALFAGCAIAFLVYPNKEFLGDDDYLYMRGFVGFAKLILPAYFTRSGLTGLEAYGRDLLDQVFFLRHGPFPSLLFGAWYAGWEALGLPFSFFFYRLPIALLASLVPVIFYRVLRNCRYGVMLSLLAATILAASPIYFGAARGVATYFAIGVVFAQALAVWALQRLDRAPDRPVVPGLALYVLVCSDPLFFLALPALLLAFALRNASLVCLIRAPNRMLGIIRDGAAPLRQPWLWVPPAVAIIALVTATIVAEIVNRLNIFGYDRLTSLSSIFRAHAAAGGHFESLGSRLLLQGAMTFGELAPIATLVTVVLLVWRRGHPIKGMEAWFGLIAAIGYGILFYGLTPSPYWTTVLYQIYLIVPLLLLLITITGMSVSRHASTLLLSVLLASSIAGTAAFVWHQPTVHQRELTSYVTHGTSHPNHGSKALGYLIREALGTAMSRTSELPMSVTIRAPDGPTSALAFSGLMFDGEYFRFRFRRAPAIAVVQELPDGDSGSCAAALQARVTVGHDRNRAAERLVQCVLDGDRPIVAVTVVAPSGMLPEDQASTYQLTELEARFDARYGRLLDLFPP